MRGAALLVCVLVLVAAGGCRSQVGANLGASRFKCKRPLEMSFELLGCTDRVVECLASIQGKCVVASQASSLTAAAAGATADGAGPRSGGDWEAKQPSHLLRFDFWRVQQLFPGGPSGVRQVSVNEEAVPSLSSRCACPDALQLSHPNQAWCC